MKIKPNNQSLVMFETPWLKNNVEDHLVFGPLAKHFSLAWLLLIIFVINFVVAFFQTEGPLFLKLLANLSKLLFILVSIYLFEFPRYHQAAIGWCIVKAMGGLFAFIMLMAGGLVGFSRGQPDAVHISLLAVIWMPGIEFIPQVNSKQKIITLIRFVVSVPIIYLWYKTGTWSW
jgi:hypothetical protein